MSPPNPVDAPQPTPDQSESPPLQSSSTPTEPGRKRRKVTRSRAGCLTCRKRRKLCDMAKPHCGACNRLRMECVWPEVKSFERASSQRSASSSPDLTPSSAGPSTTAAQLLNDLNSTNTSHLFAPHTEQSAVDGLMDLFAANHTDTSHTNAFNHPSNGSIPSISPTVPMQPFQYPSSLSLPSHSLPHPHVSAGELFGGNDIFSFDDATLQLWAADVLPALNNTGAQNPFDSLNDLLFPHDVPMTLPSAPPPAITPASTTSTIPLVTPGPTDPKTTESHAAILAYYKDCLARLVSCGGKGDPNDYDAFTSLAYANISSLAGQGLHMSILAWAGRHMVNRGQANYEAVSERLSGQATQIIMDKLMKENLKTLEQSELLTLFSGLIMLISFKICRGDVWGFDNYIEQMAKLSHILFPEDKHDIDLNSTLFIFFQNMLYHYVVSSYLIIRGPFMSDASLFAYSKPAINTLHTLCGVNLQSFCIMHQIAGLIRTRRAQKGVWTDEALADIIKEAERIEKDLELERTRLDKLVQSQKDLTSHRYFHEAFRIACLLQLRCLVLSHPPISPDVKLLVRKSLSLLETMAEQNLPGFCSAHWVLFTTAICSSSGGVGPGEMDDQARVEKLYDTTINSLAFLNTSRSRNIVREVWARNQGGKIMVDWIDILIEYDWEIILT